MRRAAHASERLRGSGNGRKGHQVPTDPLGVLPEKARGRRRRKLAARAKLLGAWAALLALDLACWALIYTQLDRLLG